MADSGFAHLRGDATLAVYIDLKSPYAYLAVDPTREMAKGLGVEINWLPIAGQVLRPPSSPSPDDDRGVFHRRKRAEMIA